MQKKFVYADNAATTRTSEKAVEAMLPLYTKDYGNPSSIYPFAYSAKKALEAAREAVAAALGADARDIYFTSGGTEADNWAIRGAAYSNIKKGKHLITSKIEHHAVLHPLQVLEKEGFEITYLDVDKYGLVSPETLRAAMRPDTTLVTIMAANNEIGTVEPISELAATAHERGALFHTDAVQAVGHIPIDVKAMGIDLLSLSAHKFNGPKGVGALYSKKGSRVSNLIEGGGQERGRRSGTENTAGAAGLAAALSEAVAELESEAARLTKMRDRLIEGILKISETKLTGHPEKRLPGIVSVTIKGIEGESIVLSLANAGICASSGSACSTASLDPSHVLMSIGLTHEIAHGSLRLSFGKYTTDEEIDYILDTLPGVIEKLRAMSPVWNR